MRLRILAALSVLALFTLVGCGDNENDDNDNGGDSASMSDVTRDDLAVLVLPADELGELVEDLAIDPDSGYRENAEYAEDSLDPDDTEQSVAEGGRIDGYRLGFGVDDPFEALSAGEGLILASTSAELFDTADNASADLEKRVTDFLDHEGETVDGIELTEVERLEVSDIGDEAGGLYFVAGIPGTGVSFQVTIAFMRMGPVVGSVQLQAADEDDRAGQAEDVLRDLESRMQQFADGDLADATPVPIPTEDPVIGDGDNGDAEGDGDGPSGSVVDVAPAALTLDDLPEGFAVTGEEYDPVDPDFTRSFEADSGLTVTVGTSEIIGIESNVILFESSFEATAFVGVIGSLLSGEGGQSFFGDALEQEGLEGEVELTSREIAVGDEGIIIEGPIDVGFMQVQMAFIVGRLGEGISALIVTGLPDAFNSDDFIPLLETTLSRLDDLPRE